MISRRIYLTIVILILMVFVMFMFVGVSSNILSDISKNRGTGERVNINGKDILTADKLNLDISSSMERTAAEGVLNPGQKLQVAILSGGSRDATGKILIEWCVYNKYFYKIFTSLPAAEDLADFEVVLFGGYKLTARDCEQLYAYAEMGKTMIFTQPPEYQEISSNQKLAAFFGIRAAINKEIIADGIKIFSDFMINKVREYKKDDYYGNQDDTQVSIPYYTLAAGYEVYAVGMLENQEELEIEDKDLPPLLWRSITKKSFVFVINSDIFHGTALLGVLTGFMAHERECYVHPIVNAQTISLLNYPYFSDENSEQAQRLYSRTSEAVARDLLWPNVVQILKNYGNSYGFFAAGQLDYLDTVGPKGDYLEFYLREINKLPGDIGLSLDQVSKISLEDMISANENFFAEHLPDYNFTALYAAGFDMDEVKSCLDQEFLGDIRLVMSDYTEGDSLISFLKEDVISVKFILDGYQHETMDDLRMCCIENALGMCNVKVDIGRVIYPENSLDEWNKLSLQWSRGDTYFEDYSMLDMVSIYELEKRIKRFMALDYTYEYHENTIDIHIDHFDEEAYFMLYICSKSIEAVENGSAEAVSSTAYLIKAAEADVRIRLKEENVLGKPKNNKIIPSKPN